MFHIIVLFFVGVAVLAGVGYGVATLISNGGRFPRWHPNPYKEAPGVEAPNAQVAAPAELKAQQQSQPTIPQRDRIYR